MVSPRRAARFGVAAAIVTFSACLAVLASGNADDRALLASQPGYRAPNFTLVDAADRHSGKVELESLRGSTVVLAFCSVRCPVSSTYDARLVELSNRFGKDGRVRFVAVHVGTGARSGDEVAVRAMVAGLRFPQLIDVDGAVARAYAVTTTPTYLVIDPAGQVQYRGSLDDSRTLEQVTQHYLADAVAAVRGGQPVERRTTVVEGCVVR